MSRETLDKLNELVSLATAYLVVCGDASWFRTALEVGGFDHGTATRMTNAMLKAARSGRAFSWSWPATVEG